MLRVGDIDSKRMLIRVKFNALVGPSGGLLRGEVAKATADAQSRPSQMAPVQKPRLTLKAQAAEIGASFLCGIYEGSSRIEG
jgi:hypothetical protein